MMMLPPGADGEGQPVRGRQLLSGALRWLSRWAAGPASDTPAAMLSTSELRVLHTKKARHHASTHRGRCAVGRYAGRRGQELGQVGALLSLSRVHGESRR